MCALRLLFTPTPVFTGVAGVTSIDAGETGVVGGAGVAGVAGGTGVPFLGGDAVRRSFLLRSVSSRWRCLRLVHTSCALAWLPFFFLLTGFMRHMNDILRALQAFCLIEPLMALRVFPK